MGGVVPEWDRGDGACVYLTPSLGCSIYAIRPYICRTEYDGCTDAQRAAFCDWLAEHYAA
jgi:Fe-S-cluster containining protein